MIRFTAEHLLTVDKVPPHYQEKCIISGYRQSKSSPRQCALSVFEATNETLNFWTHFLPFWYFLWKLLEFSSVHDFYQDPYTWPLLSYMITACIYPITSSIAHTFSAMSDEARHICFFLDYSAISLYSLGAGISYRAYVFPDSLMNTSFAGAFLYIVVFNSIVSFFLACLSRFPKSHHLQKVLRMTAFAYPYLFDSGPLVYRLLTEEGPYSSYWPHVRQFTFAALCMSLYATHFPEAFIPGKFDIIGHSHQLFHIAGILATTEQIHGVLNDMQSRRTWLIDHMARDVTITFTWSIGAVLIVIIVNALVILFFANLLYRRGHKPHVHYRDVKAHRN